MSDDKKSGLGLFISKKSATPSNAAAVSSGSRQKDVKKRWMYVGLAAVGVIVVATTTLSDKKPTRAQRERAEAMINVTPPNADKAAFEAKFGQDLESFKNQLEKLSIENETIAKRLAEAEERLKARNNTSDSVKQPPAGIVPPPGFDNSGGLTPLAPVVMPPAPPFAPIQPPSQGTLPPPVSVQEPLGEPMVFSLGKTSEGPNASQPNVESKVNYRRNASSGLLPAGAFAPVVLLNGLDAGTSAATQSNPMPVLMTVTNQATLPGASKYRLKSCFVLGNGYGDLSAERVYIRFNRLSCVDKSDRLILSQEVAGYVVDSDGKLGLRGKVADRQGARLGKALLAGFAQGLSGALGSAQGTLTSNLGTGTTMNSISGSAALRASGLSGAQTAAQQIAEFYLREAQAIFPVVSVDTGRKGTIVFTNSVSLNWTTGDTRFVKDVTPQ